MGNGITAIPSGPNPISRNSDERVNGTNQLAIENQRQLPAIEHKPELSERLLSRTSNDPGTKSAPHMFSVPPPLTPEQAQELKEQNAMSAELQKDLIRDMQAKANEISREQRSADTQANLNKIADKLNSQAKDAVSKN